MFFRMVYKSGPIFLPFCHNPRVWQTDRQTDGWTDRNLITIPRLHYMQRGKKQSSDSDISTSPTLKFASGPFYATFIQKRCILRRRGTHMKVP